MDIPGTHRINGRGSRKSGDAIHNYRGAKDRAISVLLMEPSCRLRKLWSNTAGPCENFGLFENRSLFCSNPRCEIRDCFRKSTAADYDLPPVLVRGVVLTATEFL